jgi:hypothetical protein
MKKSPQHEIERYLDTGEYDAHFPAWQGDDFLARTSAGHAALQEALVSAVQQRAAEATAPKELAALDVVAFTRAKVAPMVRGLFPKNEQDIVLDLLRRSVVFLTPATIGTVLREMQWLGTAWDLANLYLASVGAAPLSKDAPRIVGLSEATTCFVSAEYFRTKDRFEDIVLHETAHIFHNCKRKTIGLRETRRHVWLLDIDFSRRETFAYACEAYSRIIELGDKPSVRHALLSELENAPPPPDERVDVDEYFTILRQAVAARNGWKRIFELCRSAQ